MNLNHNLMTNYLKKSKRNFYKNDFWQVFVCSSNWTNTGPRRSYRLLSTIIFTLPVCRFPSYTAYLFASFNTIKIILKMPVTYSLLDWIQRPLFHQQTEHLITSKKKIGEKIKNICWEQKPLNHKDLRHLSIDTY